MKNETKIQRTWEHVHELMAKMKRLDGLADKVEHIMERQRAINDKLNNIIHTRNHYLRHRAPAVMVKQKKMLAKLSKMVERFDAIPRMRVKVSGKAKEGRCYNTLLLVTNNQAEKLKAIADSNLIGLLNSRTNTKSGDRVVLGYKRKKRRPTMAQSLKAGIDTALEG